jgi:hypothetical protein
MMDDDLALELDRMVRGKAAWLRHAALMIGFDFEDLVGACWEGLMKEWNEIGSFNRCHPAMVAKRAAIDFLRHHGGRDEARRINVEIDDRLYMRTDPGEAMDLVKMLRNRENGIPTIRNAGRLW